MLASRGHEVVGYDVNARAVDSINGGRAHFFEPDLDMLLDAAVRTGRLKAQTEPSLADYYVIAVPTPVREDKTPDLSHVEAATAAIAPFLKSGATIILESTSPVGTTERMAAELARLRPDLACPVYGGSGENCDFHLAHCPERILPGHMVRELITNDRIIGGMTKECSQRALDLYSSFVTGACVVTDCRTAELVKTAENSYRDVNIAFANELSLICDHLGIDVWQTIEFANHHPRVNILQPGAGVGGHCIAVDPWFIVHSAPGCTRLIRAARAVNDEKPDLIVGQIREHATRFRRPVVALFGITYKPDVEDLRESPALGIARAIAALPDMEVLVCEPHVAELPPGLAGQRNVRRVDIDEALSSADIVAILVGHHAFKSVDASRLLNKLVVDAVGLFSKSAVHHDVTPSLLHAAS
jgi:UDP-N-acetyl-D-mannosaminuronic acid dehydrogenase